MKSLPAVIALLILASPATISAGDMPREVAGFILGQDITSFRDRLQMDTALPIRYQEYLQEAEIKATPGFKSGLITYGSCREPNRIVRIKLKYTDASREFYDALLARVKRRFGKPTTYEGDPFHIVVGWKWSFSDPDGNRVTLNLSHNSRDAEEKFGNAIKLTFTSALAEERRCFLEKSPPADREQSPPRQPLESMTPKDWKPLIPD